MILKYVWYKPSHIFLSSFSLLGKANFLRSSCCLFTQSLQYRNAFDAGVILLHVYQLFIAVKIVVVKIETLFIIGQICSAEVEDAVPSTI